MPGGLGVASQLPLVLLLGQMTSDALPQERLQLSHNLSGIVHFRAVDGITVMSTEFYKDDHLYRVANIMPPAASQRLLIQFVYVDLPLREPCQDSLQICMMSRLHDDIRQCRHALLEVFCGYIPPLISEDPGSTPVQSLETVHGGEGVSIRWRTTRPNGRYKGFKLIITAFSDQRQCDSDQWRCDAGRCIHRDLRCDEEFHCKDGTDETQSCPVMNFTDYGALESPAYSIDEPYDLERSIFVEDKCHDQMLCVARWGQKWLGLIIPSCLVLLLVLSGLAHKLYIRFLRDGTGLELELVATRNRHLQRRQRQRRQRICHVATQQPELDAIERDVGSAEELDGAVQQEMMVLNPMAGMLLPPPYFPKEPDTDSLCPPTEGEPPPLYEDLTPSCDEYTSVSQRFSFAKTSTSSSHGSPHCDT